MLPFSLRALYLPGASQHYLQHLCLIHLYAASCGRLACARDLALFRGRPATFSLATCLPASLAFFASAWRQQGTERSSAIQFFRSTAGAYWRLPCWRAVFGRSRRAAFNAWTAGRRAAAAVFGGNRHHSSPHRRVTPLLPRAYCIHLCLHHHALLAAELKRICTTVRCRRCAHMWRTIQLRAVWLSTFPQHFTSAPRALLHARAQASSGRHILFYARRL